MKEIKIDLGDQNEIQIKGLDYLDNTIEQAKNNGDINYELIVSCDGFFFKSKMQDLIGGITIFVEDLNDINTTLKGSGYWGNSDTTVFTKDFPIFEIRVEAKENGKINLNLEIAYKNSELRYSKLLDQTYLNNWIAELNKIIK